MFIGHYGVSLAAKRFAPRASLGALFLGAQFLDVVGGALVLAGVEKIRVVPGFTKTNAYDAYFIPYSHSLAGAILWSAVVALGYGAIAGRTLDAKPRVALAATMAAAVFSHFVLDVPMHIQDLPLGFDGGPPKLGLGLWNQPDVTIALELGLLVAGGAVYLGCTKAGPGGETPTWIAGGALALLAVATPLLPPPSGPTDLAIQGLGAYAVLAALAEWVDRGRVTVPPAL